MKTCLIYYRKEPGKGQPAPDVEFICSDCTQKLCNATQEQIKDLYQKAVDKGLEAKAGIFKTFISEEEEDEQRNPKRDTSKHTYRKRPLRVTRNEQNTNFGFKKGKKVTLYQNHK